jgi:predicted MFS family arabinose efflux permease
VVFISQVAATFVVLPLGGFMANRVKEEKKGSAAGWFQAGNLGGVGLGGGAGLWLTTHYNVQVAGIVLSITILVFASTIILISDVHSKKGRRIGEEIKQMAKDVISMLKIPIALFIMLLICMPIGSGAASNVWSSIADDWHVSADTVALITGVISGIVSTIGCVVGGWIADKFGIWWAYLGSGTVCALAATGMAALPYNPNVYIAGVLTYGFSLGLVNAAFSAILLYAIGKKSASTKYSLLSSLGNIPVVYMTNFDGWAHDNGGSKYMLLVEGAVGISCVILCIAVLKWMKNKQWIIKPV